MLCQLTSAAAVRLKLHALFACHAGYPPQPAPGPKTADQPPAWAYAAAAPTWDAPPQSTPALGNTADPMHNAPAFYGSGPPEFSGQTIYNVNQVGAMLVSDLSTCWHSEVLGYLNLLIVPLHMWAMPAQKGCCWHCFAAFRKRKRK